MIYGYTCRSRRLGALDTESGRKLRFLLDLRIAQLLELGYCFSVAPECRRQNGSRLNLAVAERCGEGGIRCTLRRRNAALCTNPFALIGSWRIVGLRAVCCFGSLFILA